MPSIIRKMTSKYWQNTGKITKYWENMAKIAIFRCQLVVKIKYTVLVGCGYNYITMIGYPAKPWHFFLFREWQLLTYIHTFHRKCILFFSAEREKRSKLKNKMFTFFSAERKKKSKIKHKMFTFCSAERKKQYIYIYIYI